MERQPEITWKLRKTLITWLIEVHTEYDLRPETLYLAINYLDRVSQRRNVNRQTYQLLGTTALWVAAKYEENHGRVPTLKNLMYICCNIHKAEEFVAMEQSILRDLNFVMGHPTAESFLKAECRSRSGALYARTSLLCSNMDDYMRNVNHTSNATLTPPTPALTPLDLPTREKTSTTATATLSSSTSTSSSSSSSSDSLHHLVDLQQSSAALVRVVARFVMELTLVHKRFLSYRPSLIARASLLIAEMIVGFIAPYHHHCQWSGQCTSKLSSDDVQLQNSLAAGLNHTPSAKFHQIVCYTSSGHLSVTTVDPVVAKILAHLDDCLNCPPKQILDKYKADRFMNVGMYVTSWIENR